MCDFISPYDLRKEEPVSFNCVLRYCSVTCSLLAVFTQIDSVTVAFFNNRKELSVPEALPRVCFFSSFSLQANNSSIAIHDFFPENSTFKIVCNIFWTSRSSSRNVPHSFCRIDHSVSKTDTNLSDFLRAVDFT